MTEDYVTIRVKCRYCGSIHFIKVKMSDYRKYCIGMLCRDYFPTLTEDEYNLIAFNVCKDCFNDIFSEW